MPAHEWGDRGDLNPRPLGPQPSALTGLSYDHHAVLHCATHERNYQRALALLQPDLDISRRSMLCETVKRGVIHVSNE